MSIINLALVAFVLQAPVPDPATVQQWHEAGQDQQVVQAVADGSDPAVVYLAALSYQRLKRTADAQRMFERLIARGASDPWAAIGRSGVLLNTTAAGSAVGATAATAATAAIDAAAAARAAVKLVPSLAQAHYQLGLVYGRQRDYASAVTAFEAAVAADPRFAYAHYYVGLSYYQVKRTDKMAAAFEYFLRLAPKAPERPQVQSIMRTLRGR